MAGRVGSILFLKLATVLTISPNNYRYLLRANRITELNIEI